VLAVAALHLLFCALAFDPGAYPGGDNGTYVSLARGLLERGVYVDYWDPAMAPHTMYPPVFPLLLAAGMWMGLSVWVGVKTLCLVLSAAAAGFAFLWLRRILSPRAAIAAGVIMAVAPGALALANQVLSDVPFWTWAMLTLWALARADEEPASRRWEVIGTVGVVLGFFTRSAGLPLVVAVGAWIVLHRRWRALGILAGTLGPLAIAWTLRNRAVGGTSVYAREFWWINPYVPSLGTIGPKHMVLRIADNLWRYASQHVPELLFGRIFTEAPWVVVPSIALVALAVAGWAGRVRRPTVAELFVPLYIGLLLIWPATWGGSRFVLPLMPLLLGYAGLALRDVSVRMKVSLLAPLAAGLLLLLELPGVATQARLGAECRADYARGVVAPCLPPEWSDLLSVGRVLRGRLPEGSVVIHRKPTLFFAVSGYRSRMYPKSASADTFFALVREAHASYLVLDQIQDMAPYLHAVVTRNKERFCIVPQVSLPQAVVARIVENAPPLPARFGPDDYRTCPLTGPPFPGAPPR
jgi:4-amino-4-deoxy-L-arabinose transferase-like glycosyltransferase